MRKQTLTAGIGRRKKLKFLKLCRCMLLFVVISGCAAPKPFLEKIELNSGKPLSSVQWVKSVSKPEHAGITGGIWKRTLDLITGGTTQAITKPYGNLFDNSGRLFVVDTGAHNVHMYDTKNNLAEIISGNNSCPLRSPIGLAEDDSGVLYITDSVEGVVCRYDIASNSLALFATGLSRPTGISYDRVNKVLYVTETKANRITALDLGGAVTSHIYPKKAEMILFNHPTDLAVDNIGRLYVTDPLNYRIRVFSPEGDLAGDIGTIGDQPGELQKPKGIAVDTQGNIFVADALMDGIQVFDAEGRFKFSFGVRGVNNGEFWMPSGVSIHDDHIFVSDTYNNRVQIFRRVNSTLPDKDQTNSKR